LREEIQKEEKGNNPKRIKERIRGEIHREEKRGYTKRREEIQ
jgi:hypothetical protein